MRETYDHMVRNENSLNAIRKYIRENPSKAGLHEGEFLQSTVTILGDRCRGDR